MPAVARCLGAYRGANSRPRGRRFCHPAAAVDHETIARLCATHDLLVLDNAGSLWSAPEASVAWQQHALAARIPTIARHHDPAWHGRARRCVVPTPNMVPLHHPNFVHVLINELTRQEFAKRWPVLADTDALRVVHNRVDVAGLSSGDRAQARAKLNVAEDSVLVVHLARVEATNKNIPGAVLFANELDSLLGRQVCYWLTDPSEDAPSHVAEALRSAPGLRRGYVDSQADLYAASDLGPHALRPYGPTGRTDGASRRRG
jgi:mannosylglucosylglycerate synthase